MYSGHVVRNGDSIDGIANSLRVANVMALSKELYDNCGIDSKTYVKTLLTLLEKEGFKLTEKSEES